jgi:UDP-N-acetylmuramyl tripeptide synthase
MKSTPKSKKLLAKLLSSYYGNPAKDLKIIIAPDPTMAAFIYEILKTAGHNSSLTPVFSLTQLHKSLSKSWKQGATHVVVSTTSVDLLHGLPVHIAVDLSLPTTHLVLNRDSAFYSSLQASPAKISTYGSHPSADTRIDRSKLYKKGSEAHLAHGTELIQVATYATGDSAVMNMAAATAVAKLLDVASETIADGLANYEPAPEQPSTKQ